MQPRLKSSKKWTAFPADYLEQIRSLFLENFKAPLGEGELVIEGRIYTNEIMLRVGYLEKGRLAQSNFEVSVDYSTDQKDVVEKLGLCVDAAASMMDEYFENDGEVDFPFAWKSFPFNKKTLFLKYSTENSRLEEEANRLLGVTQDSLVVEEDETDDALERAEVKEDLSGGQDLVGEVFGEDEDHDDESESEDDPEDDGKPKMFRKKPTKH